MFVLLKPLHFYPTDDCIAITLYVTELCREINFLFLSVIALLLLKTLEGKKFVFYRPPKYKRFWPFAGAFIETF